MRALVMRPDSLLVEERPMPEPGPGQVLVKSLVCGICGSDLHLYRHAQHFYQMGLDSGVPAEVLDRGVILGHEFIGEIAAFGVETKQDLSIGQRVCSTPFLKGELESIAIGSTPLIDGAYAEYFLLSEELLIPVPDDLPSDAAALTEPLAIGLHAVNKAQLAEDRVAVVVGCGPIGLASIVALKLRGCNEIIAADYSEKRRQLAQALGATVVVNPAEADSFSAIPADHQEQPATVFECTGVNGVLGECIDAAPALSEIIVAGISHGEDSFTPATAIAKQLSIHFVMFYSSDEYADALRALASGSINWQPWITGKVGLDGIARAFEDLRDPELHAKILIYPHGVHDNQP